jgi:hypothetical protein
MTDEIMQELHSIKDSIGLKYAQNREELYKQIQIGEARLKAAGVLILPPPTDDEPPSFTALQRTRFSRR